MSPEAQRGWRLFTNEAGCSGCHVAQDASMDVALNLDGGSKTANTPSDETAVFAFHNTGLYNLPGEFSYPADNTGLHAHTGTMQDVGRFRVPSLRNVGVTAPYMHDGSIGTLERVLVLLAGGAHRISESVDC